MSWPVFKLALRARLPLAAGVGFALIAVLLATGALFPAVGHSFGKLNLSSGVSRLLGGADYTTPVGWFRSEIASIYGPLLIAATTITAGSAMTAGEEEDRILALVLAHPVRRSHLVASKAAAVAALAGIVALATWIGLISGGALAGGGIGVWRSGALSLQLAFFGLAIGSMALAVGAGVGRRSLAIGVAAGIAALGWLINGFAAVVSAIAWSRFLSPFYYYARHDALARGVDYAGLATLGVASVVLVAAGIVAFEGRDLRA
jgi:ABC-2 type transport system permease protein